MALVSIKKTHPYIVLLRFYYGSNCDYYNFCLYFNLSFSFIAGRCFIFSLMCLSTAGVPCFHPILSFFLDSFLKETRLNIMYRSSGLSEPTYFTLVGEYVVYFGCHKRLVFRNFFFLLNFPQSIYPKCFVHYLSLSVFPYVNISERITFNSTVLILISICQTVSNLF